MKRIIAVLIFISLVSPLTSPAAGQVRGFEDIKWSREKLAPGLVWKYSRTVIDDTVPQNINILLVDTRRRDLILLYSPSKNIPSSVQAAGAGALAAINAGFFNIKNGGSASYIKVDGRIVDSDTASKWKRVVNLNGSVVITSGGKVLIMRKRENSAYDSETLYRDVLVTGPMLVENGKRAFLPQTSLVIARHPRTSIGTLKKHRVLFMTVDGRTGQSHGMTLVQLADLMLLLKCENAINLDGGGSTTMYIKGKPFKGVVNMPCDNKKFDHEGERAVSSLFIVK
jgi:exopolysaccharide biosynthesis protein